MKIIIAGGTGFLGEALSQHFIQQGHEVGILSRRANQTKNGIHYYQWDGKTLSDWAKALDGADVLINMAGRTVDCRYTEKNKAEILDSRLFSTKILGEAIAQAQQPPKVWLNSSSATIYKDTRGDVLANNEFSTNTGDDFSMNVCKSWEKAFENAATPQTRKLILRTTIVLGKGGGAMSPLANLTKLWLGGTQGDGNQFFSWLHLDDFVQIVDFLIQNTSLEGVFNLAAPNPLPNRDFMRALRKACSRSWGLPMPAFLLKFGAILIRTEAELILKSRKVVSQKLADAGYIFKYPTVETALAEIFGA